MINNLKNQKGITLITLIVTVILLIIITATIALNVNSSLELSNLTKLENDIQALNDRVAVYYVANGTLPVTSDTYTKTQLANRITNLSANDGDIYYKIDLAKLSNITLNYGNYTYIINETSHSIYNLEGISYNGTAYHTTGKQTSSESILGYDTFTNEQIQSMIGGYVNYTTKSGIYDLITNSDEYAGTADNTSDFTTETFNWRIWSIDGTKLTLIADDVTKTGGTSNNGTLSLYGAVGYNNGVKILNDICKNCYSNSEYGAIGRSINIEDIENVLDRTVWKPEDYGIQASSEFPKYYAYGQRSEYTRDKKYPYIWQFEEFTKIVNENRIISNERASGLTRSTQNEYYYGENYSSLTADISINPIQTFWYNVMNANNFNNQNHYYLIYSGTSSTYFLSSRYTHLPENTELVCGFGLQRINNEGNSKIVRGGVLYSTRGGSSKQSSTIRPMVEINLTQVSLDTTTTSGVDAQNAYKLLLVSLK